MPSFKAQLALFRQRISSDSSAAHTASAAALTKFAEQDAVHGSALPQGKVTRFYAVERTKISKQDVYTITSYASPECFAVSIRILYFHGDLFVDQMSDHEWEFLMTLIKAMRGNGIDVHITIPIYPLATPNPSIKGTSKRVLAFAESAYNHMLNRSKGSASDIFFMGHGSGGAIALSLALKVKESQNQPLPCQLILLSPILDLTFSNSEIPAAEARDPIHRVAGLVEAGRLYAEDREEGVQHHLVSPLLASKYLLRSDILERTHVLVGRNSILYPDCELLHLQAKRRRTQLAGYHVFDGMWHGFIMSSSLSETHEAMGIMVTAFKSAWTASGNNMLDNGARQRNWSVAASPFSGTTRRTSIVTSKDHKQQVAVETRIIEEKPMPTYQRRLTKDEKEKFKIFEVGHAAL